MDSGGASTTARLVAAALGQPMLSRLSGDELDALLLRTGWLPAPGQDPTALARGFLLDNRNEKGRT